MKSISRRQFVSRVSLSAAAAMAYSKIGYSAIGNFSSQPGVEDYNDVEITHGKIRGLLSRAAIELKAFPGVLLEP